MADKQLSPSKRLRAAIFRYREAHQAELTARGFLDFEAYYEACMNKIIKRVIDQI